MPFGGYSPHELRHPGVCMCCRCVSQKHTRSTFAAWCQATGTEWHRVSMVCETCQGCPAVTLPFQTAAASFGAIRCRRSGGLALPLPRPPMVVQSGTHRLNAAIAAATLLLLEAAVLLLLTWCRPTGPDRPVRSHTVAAERLTPVGGPASATGLEGFKQTLSACCQPGSERFTGLVQRHLAAGLQGASLACWVPLWLVECISCWSGAYIRPGRGVRGMLCRLRGR